MIWCGNYQAGNGILASAKSQDHYESKNNERIQNLHQLRILKKNALRSIEIDARHLICIINITAISTNKHSLLANLTEDLGPYQGR